MSERTLPEPEPLGAGLEEAPREARPVRGRKAPRAARRALLLGTPREVLARLALHDPLGVRQLVAERLGARSLLMDADRVYASALARIARAARGWLGAPPLDAWLAEQVDAAIDALRRAEAACADAASASGAWSELARPLGLEPAEMRRACARFNLLPSQERADFVHLVLERRSPDELARERGESLSALARRARRAIDLFLGAQPAPDDPRGER